MAKGSIRRSRWFRAAGGALFAAAGALGVALAQSGPGPANERTPGAKGDVAAQVPDQAAQARKARVTTAARSAGPRAGQWYVAGQGGVLPALMESSDEAGKLGVLNAQGPVQTKGHPFFEPLGSNGRGCVTCHQPADAMSVSVKSLQKRWVETGGKDPVFAMVDGANCPSMPPLERASHSLLLDRGLFRVFLPWPPKKADGSPMAPEFDLEVVRDPTGCNTSPVYGLNSPKPMVSVYRRTRPAANLKYVVSANAQALFIIKNGMPNAVDPETGEGVGMNFMADARQPTLKTQALDATFTHGQARRPPSNAQLQQIVDFEMQVYAGQRRDRWNGLLVDPSGYPHALGPENLSTGKTGVLGDNYTTPVFLFFDKWKRALDARLNPQEAFRASVARGADVFFSRPFWISDAMHINTVGLGNPAKRTCATCHNMHMTAMDLTAGWMDLGTTNLPWANESPELPLFKVTCHKDLPPHPFLGRVIYTHDPGRALISGKCNDVGTIVMQQFRGLSARAPYFSNGSALTLRELVDFYDRRFNIRFSEQEKQDLVNFLSVL